MSEVDRPSLFLVDFNIPAFTPGRHTVYATLDLSPFLRSEAYRQVSSAKRAKFAPGVWGVSFIYKLYRVGDRTEPCGTPACMYLGVEFSPSTDTLNFRWERNELISLINVVENCNLDTYRASQCAMLYQRLFRYPRIPQL
jgi:hypothetical protein